MLKIRRTLPCAWLWLWVLASAIPTSGDAADPSGSPFIVDSWNNEQGLPQSSVISVVQTRDGYLWLGTLNGLVRFDGIHFHVFDENNTPGLGSGRVVRLFEDSHTNFWIGTDTAGVTLIGNGTLKNFNIGRSGHEGRLTSISENSDGAVWLYTADAHLARYQNGKMDILDLPFTAPAIARMIAAEKSGPIWIAEFEPGGKSGLFSFYPANFIPPTLAVDQSIPAQGVDFILAGQSGGIWRLMDGRIQKWSKNRLERDLGPYPWGNTNLATFVTSACEDNEGNLIVGTLGAGVFWYEPDGKLPADFQGPGLVIRLCAFVVHGSRRKSLGRNRRRGSEPHQKRKFSIRRPDFARWPPSPFPKMTTAVYGRPSMPWRHLLDAPIPRKILA